MKLWKILLATMIALVLVCAVAMADTCAHDWKSEYVSGYEYAKHSDTHCVITADDHQFCTKCGETRVIDAAPQYVPHELVLQEKVAATCEKVGYNRFKCLYCKGTVDQTMTPATGHSPVLTYIKGDCQNKAKDVTACQWCGKVFSTVEYAKGDHAYEVKGTVAPTCKADGYNVYVCKVCGDEKHWDVTPAGHKWVPGTVVAPTCTEKGYTNYACSACGETAKFDYKDAAHKPVIHEKKAATCGTPGYDKYISCANCSDLWDAAGAPIKSIPVIEPDASLHEYNDYNGWVVMEKATCTKNGQERNMCIHCGHKIYRTIETKGHTYADVSKLQAKPAGVVAGIGYVTTPSTCTTAGSGWLECTVCNDMTKSVTIPAHGHAWGAWEYSGRATCTTAMTGTRKCGWNGAHTETIVVAEALGHAWQVLTGTDATCTENGKVTRYCPACGTKEADKVVPATGHSYKWTTVVAPSAAGNGKDEYKCTVCGDVKEVKTVKYTKWYYNNTMTSFGPTTKELVGGSDWYRVTPVDLAVDGVYTYDLIASNKYVVGTVTITVNAGTLTVSYNAKGVEITDEALLIYASKADLATGTAVTAPVGAAINAAETFGADTKVLVSLILTGNYDAAGKGLIDASAAAGMIANID